MTEQNISEKETLLNAYRQSGKVTTLTGIKPDEAIQKLINEDPEKRKAFIEGATEGQLLKENEENG